jgi:hypothetical protein
MIISASVRTDIPAFYGAWMMARLRAGYCLARNPFSQQAYRVSLLPADVDGIVFWTKNSGPFQQHLAEVRERGFAFVVQHTINGYPRALETSVADPRRAVENAHRVAATYGPRVLVWRYDPIVFSSLTPPELHLENFGRLSEALRGATDEVVISFAQIYQKTRRNLDAAAAGEGFTWWDPSAEDKMRLTSALVPIVAANGMALSICSQRDLLVPGAQEARCADARRLESISGRTIEARLKGNRAPCGCFETRDIGDYDTCPHGCVYCYAVRSPALAAKRFRRHDPDSEFLYSPAGGDAAAAINRQPPLPSGSETVA